MAGRFIKLYDKILNWEWYDDINTFRLFVHLLLKANYKDLKFEGQKILRGQLVTSLSSLASQTGLTVRQVRVSLDKLKMTGEVTSKATNRYTVITVIKYDDYQSNDKQDGNQMTGKRANKGQTDDKQMTNGWQTNDKQMTTSIEDIEQIEQIEKIEPPTVGRTASRFTPPAKEEIFDFCMENRLAVDVDRFYDYYTSNGWKVGKNPMKDWKATVRNWAREKRQETARSGFVKTVPAQQFTQRSYENEQDEAMQRMIDEMRKAGLA